MKLSTPRLCRTLVLAATATPLLLSPLAHAQRTLSKYTALVRQGDTTQDEHYSSLPRDSNGDIAELEMQCTPRVYYSQFMKGLRELSTESITFNQGFSVADSACFIDKHYRVWLAPRPDNTKRCVVHHVPVSVVQGCFHSYGTAK